MFLLSDDSCFTVETGEWAGHSDARNPEPPSKPRALWRVIEHTQQLRLGLAIPAGSQIVFEPVHLGDNETGFFTCGASLVRIDDNGLEFSLRFRPAGAGAEAEIGLTRTRITSYDSAKPWEEIEIDLAACRGKTGSFVVRCGAGLFRESSGVLYELVVAPPEQRTLERARAFRQWRTQNENAHFSSVQTPEYAATPPRGRIGWLPDWFRGNPPLSPPSAQRYAGELLQQNLGVRIPDYVGLLKKRIRKLKSGKKLRVLALCSGTAQKEAILMGHVNGARVELTLMDLNDKLLERARTRLAPYCETRIAPCDVNRIDLQGEAFDIILCAAGLHHLVELEHVADAIAHGLRPGGEFWAISEYIGRPGSRLWPDAYAAANPFFQSLPEKYRLSPLTGKPDTALPNMDCSVSTFEGIRAPEIEGILAQRLQPVCVSRQACWIWRLVDSVYGKNYDLENSQDRALIRRAAALDADFQRQGGRPSGLNAVYTVR